MDLCQDSAIITTRGDRVERWSSAEELRTLFGSVDTADEVLLLVQAHGYYFSCNDTTRSAIRPVAEGYEVWALKMTSNCAPIETKRFRLHVSRAGVISELSAKVIATSEGCVGRKPAGLLSDHQLPSASTLADFLARSAHLEDASVHAFERMVQELEAHAAPAEFIARARAARADELRHAAVVRALAEARGGKVEQARVATLAVRSLEEMARENAVEGCVRETYGALLGAYQAAHAQDLELRTAMVSIAEDETRHAALSHALHAWLMSALEPAAQARVQRAQRQAMDELTRECEQLVSEPWHAQAGLPSAAVARRLIADLTVELWQPALSHAA